MKALCSLIIVIIFFPIHTSAQEDDVTMFVEFGGTAHGGRHTPLWHNSLQHGLSSIDNNAHLRFGSQWRDSINKDWMLTIGLDVAFVSRKQSEIILQQAYADLAWRCLGLSIGSKEMSSRFFNNDLSSGDLVWSGNARPIPQVQVGIFNYIPVLRSSWASVRGEMAYGWWTDGNYLDEMAKYDSPNIEPVRWYTRNIKYHRKEFAFRFGKSTAPWQLDVAYRMDNQFGGYMMYHPNRTWFPTDFDLGNGLKNYWKAFLPQKSGSAEDGLRGEKIAAEGNFLGSELFKFTYKFPQYRLSAYMQNFFDDFSGMGKMNGLDGLWGLEYHSNNKKALLRAAVLEYYQTTDQSGPLHGSDASDGEKTHGADDYYNHSLYQGWTHWGQGMANPLIPSPVYFSDQIVYSNWSRGDDSYRGYMGFPYNRVKAIHVGFQGDLTLNWAYRLKFSKSRTWGTPFSPALEPLDNLSAFFEISCAPLRWWGMQVATSVAFDQGDIYGDNIGAQIKVRKLF